MSCVIASLDYRKSQGQWSDFARTALGYLIKDSKTISKKGWSPVHTTPEEFENAALFPRLGLPSTLIRHENGASRKNALQTGAIWKRRLCVLVWTENILKAELFENDAITVTMRISSNTNPKWPVIVAFSNFSGVARTENIWCVFRVKSLFSNFSGVVWMGPD